MTDRGGTLRVPVLPDNHNHYIAWGDPDAMVEAAAAAGRDGARVLGARAPHRGGTRGVVVHRHAVRARGTARRPRRLRRDGARRGRGTRRSRSAAASSSTSPTTTPAWSPPPTRCRDRYATEWDVVIGSVHVIGDDTAIEGEAGATGRRHRLGRLPRPAGRGGRVRRVRRHLAPVRLAQSQPDAPPFVAARLDDLAEAAARADVALEVNGTDLERRPDLVEHAGRRLRPPRDARSASAPTPTGRRRPAASAPPCRCCGAPASTGSWRSSAAPAIAVPLPA